MHSKSANTDGSKKLVTLFELYKKYKTHDSAFCYRGAFSEQFTGTIIDISEGAAFRTDGSVNRKVSFLLVECFQNIIRHGENMTAQETHLDDGIFTFQMNHQGFIINSINHILNNEIDQLKTWVDQVNSMDPKELKELYLRQLSNNEMSSKGGAGLGLIELARKSGQKLIYEFEEFRPPFAKFHQQVSFIQKENEIDFNKIHETKELHSRLSGENAFLFYKGDFSQKSILPLLDIVEQNVSGGSSLTSMTRKVAHILVELLQNISKHSQVDEKGRKEGIFIIGKNQNEMFIQCGNEVNTEEKYVLEQNLNYLTSLSQEEIADLHKTAMVASLKFENKNKSGLGLIEIIKAAVKGVQYTFEPIGADRFIYAVNVTF